MFRSWVAHGVPLPPGTVTLFRYLAQSGCTTTHSGVTNTPLDDETKNSGKKIYETNDDEIKDNVEIKDDFISISTNNE